MNALQYLHREMIGTISSEMLKHVLESFAATARITLHVHNVHGENNHHKVRHYSNPSLLISSHL